MCVCSSGQTQLLIVFHHVTFQGLASYVTLITLLFSKLHNLCHLPAHLRPDWVRKLNAFRVEAAWKLGQWGDLEHHLKSVCNSVLLLVVSEKLQNRCFYSVQTACKKSPLIATCTYIPRCRGTDTDTQRPICNTVFNLLLLSRSRSTVRTGM